MTWNFSIERRIFLHSFLYHLQDSFRTCERLTRNSNRLTMRGQRFTIALFLLGSVNLIILVLCCVYIWFNCLRSLFSCVQCYLCICIVQSWLHFRFSLSFALSVFSNVKLCLYALRVTVLCVCVCFTRKPSCNQCNNKTTPTPVKLFDLSHWHELYCIKCRLFFVLLFSVFDKLYECLKCGHDNFKNELHVDSDHWLSKYILFPSLIEFLCILLYVFFSE